MVSQRKLSVKNACALDDKNRQQSLAASGRFDQKLITNSRGLLRHRHGTFWTRDPQVVSGGSIQLLIVFVLYCTPIVYKLVSQTDPPARPTVSPPSVLFRPDAMRSDVQSFSARFRAHRIKQTNTSTSRCAKRSRAIKINNKQHPMRCSHSCVSRSVRRRMRVLAAARRLRGHKRSASRASLL